MDPNELIKTRQTTHGDAWRMTGLVVSYWLRILPKSPYKVPYLFVVFMIVNKLCRIMYNPDCSEHWNDIQGWAQLVLNDIQRKEGGISNK